MTKLALAAVSAFAMIVAAAPANAATIVGVTNDNRVFTFDSATPDTVTNIQSITGLVGTLVGIDFRPANGLLYGLTNNSGTGQLFTISSMTGVATLVSTLSITLDGTAFGVDFNPVPDRLRIVSNTGQNLRVNVDTGVAVVDGRLNRGGAAVTGVTAAAYTNSFAGATSTTLYVIDDDAAVLAIQNPPNDGTLTNVRNIPRTGLTGFDIDGATGTAYVTASDVFGELGLTSASSNQFSGRGYDIDVVNSVLDIAVQPGAAVPEPATWGLMLAGFGLVGTGLRSRRRSVTFANA